MKICFEESFGKDLRGIKNNKLFERTKKIIDEIKNATVLKDIKNLKKLRGHRTFYRIKAGEYRIGFELVENRVIFTRLLHRKDIYKYFP